MTGSGPHGRIVKADLDKAPAPKPTTPPQPIAPQAAKPTGPGARQQADLLGMAYKAEPNSMIRRTIARRLAESKQTVPHFYLTLDCALDALLALRQQINARGEAKVSVNDFVIRAAALALKDVPGANASWTDEAILLYEHADISVAVATPKGLFTPVIKAAESKTVLAISAEMRALAAKAKEGKLQPADYEGGSFSISNLGMFGIRQFEAIINPPQACILAVGAGEPRPVVRDGKIEAATLMTVTLSVDHRAVDGALGAEYLAAFKKRIEDPLGLLL